MASARFHAGGAVVAAADASAHRMLVVGGMDLNRRLLDSCELYDAVVDRWLMEEARLLEEMRCCAAPIAGGSAVLAVQLDDALCVARRAVQLGLLAADGIGTDCKQMAHCRCCRRALGGDVWRMGRRCGH